MTSTSPPPHAGIQDAARHLASSQPDEAIAVLERLIVDFPCYVTAHVLLGKAYEACGRTSEALEAWHRSYFLMPGSPLIVRERMRLLRGSHPDADGASDDAPEPDEAPVGASEARHAEAGAVGAHEEVNGVEQESDTFDVDEVYSAEAGEAEEEGPPGEPDDLDTLIYQLEHAPPIRPDVQFDEEREPLDDEEDDEMVSETLALIYEKQKQYGAAARAYERLAGDRPERATELLSKAAEMRRLAGED